MPDTTKGGASSLSTQEEGNMERVSNFKQKKGFLF